MKEEAIKNKFIELRSQGLSFAKISKVLNTSKPTLIKWSKHLRDQIENLRKINWEEFKEKHNLIRKRRIILFEKILSKIEKEVERREFKDLKTDKLIEIASNITNQPDFVNDKIGFVELDRIDDVIHSPDSWCA